MNIKIIDMYISSYSGKVGVVSVCGSCAGSSTGVVEGSIVGSIGVDVNVGKNVSVGAIDGSGTIVAVGLSETSSESEDVGFAGTSVGRSGAMVGRGCAATMAAPTCPPKHIHTMTMSPMIKLPAQR